MPAVKCSSLAQSYNFSGSTWTTTDATSSPSYCYKEGGNEYPHITIIDTGKGDNNVRKFHITTEVEDSEVQTVNDHLGDLWDTANPWHTIAVAFCNTIGATVVGAIKTSGPQGVE